MKLSDRSEGQVALSWPNETYYSLFQDKSYQFNLKNVLFYLTKSKKTEQVGNNILLDKKTVLEFHNQPSSLASLIIQ